MTDRATHHADDEAARIRKWLAEHPACSPEVFAATLAELAEVERRDES